MASKKPSGLGRGLGALLGDDVMNADAQTVTTLPIAEVESNSAQPRKYFDGGGLFLFIPANGSKLWRIT